MATRRSRQAVAWIVAGLLLAAMVVGDTVAMTTGRSNFINSNRELTQAAHDIKLRQQQTTTSTVPAATSVTTTPAP
jgi:hypothetical protein